MLISNSVRFKLETMTEMYVCILILFGVTQVTAPSSSGPVENVTWTSQQVIVSRPVPPVLRMTCKDDNHNVTSNGTSACPLGYYCSNGTCQCLHSPQGTISCSKGDLDIIGCYCATYNTEKNLLQVGKCFYNCLNDTDFSSHTNSYHPLPSHGNTLNETGCSYWNRTGALCGRCLPQQYMSAYCYNFTCMHCHHVIWNWFRYIMAAYLPLTLFHFIVLFFKVNVVSSSLHAVALGSQIMSIPPLCRTVFLTHPYSKQFTAIKMILSLYGIWNLDFFRPFYSDLCLGIGILPTLALDYVIAVYPLLLMIISYLLIVLYDRNYRVITIMWRPFLSLFSLFRRNWNIRTSVVDAYATFFLLSFVKFLSVSFDLLVPTKVYYLHGDHYNYTLALYYAGDIKYFGKEHLPYGILAIAVTCVFVILPTVTLAFYQFAFFQKFLNLFPFRWYILHTFVDSFQGCYKNGTEPGTRDCRWFSAAYLVLRCISFLLYGITLNSVFYPSFILFMFSFILLLVLVQPYKTSASGHLKTNIVFLIVISMFTVAIFGVGASNIRGNISFLVLALCLSLIPLVCIVVLVFHGIFCRKQFYLELVSRFRSRFRGYEALGDSAEAVDSDRVVNPQEYPAIPVRPLVD